MQNEMTVFNKEGFGEIRSITIDNEPWFVGKDVATALGYKNTKDALAKHVEDYEKKDGVAIRDPIGREQNPVLINESGVYALILKSRLPKAKDFRFWVTSEVLPSIRKTGAYHLSPTQQISQMREERLRMKEENHQRKIALEEKKATLNHLNRILKTMKNEEDKRILICEIAFVATGRQILPLRSGQTFSAEDIGKRLGISANMVGRIANENKLKTSQFGVFRTSIVNGTERQHFEYYNTVISEIEKHLDKRKDT